MTTFWRSKQLLFGQILILNAPVNERLQPGCINHTIQPTIGFRQALTHTFWDSNASEAASCKFFWHKRVRIVWEWMKNNIGGGHSDSIQLNQVWWMIFNKIFNLYSLSLCFASVLPIRHGRALLWLVHAWQTAKQENIIGWQAAKAGLSDQGRPVRDICHHELKPCCRKSCFSNNF